MQIPLALALVAYVSVAVADDARGARRAPLTPSEIEALLTSPLRHVRAMTPVLASLVAEGMVRSPTFAYLVADLDQSDVIVHVVASQNLPPSTHGQMQLVPSLGPSRFVRLTIRADGRTEDLIALIGHELRHALEVATAADVRDDQALLRLYRRIGKRLSDPYQLESEAARDAGRQVWTEVMRR